MQNCMFSSKIRNVILQMWLPWQYIYCDPTTTSQTIFGDRPVRTTGQITSVTVVLIVLLYENWSDLLELTSLM